MRTEKEIKKLLKDTLGEMAGTSLSNRYLNPEQYSTNKTIVLTLKYVLGAEYEEYLKLLEEL